MFQLNTMVLLFASLLISTITYAEAVIKKTTEGGVVEFSNSKSSKNTKKTLIYKSENNNTVTFTDQKPKNVAYEVLRFDCFACNPHSSINWHKVKLNHTAYASTVNSFANQYNVDPALVRAIIHAESAFNSKAKSHAGAQGLMQLMPATARELGVSDSLNPQQNIEGGTKYLSQLLRQFNGNTKLASAAYNAGPNAVKKYNGVPPYEETEVYVKRVAILQKRYKNEEQL